MKNSTGAFALCILGAIVIVIGGGIVPQINSLSLQVVVSGLLGAAFVACAVTANIIWEEGE